MMKIKKQGAAALLFLFTLSPLTMSAQEQKKLFTLEDLNSGGTNFHNLRPKNMFLEWWGDKLVQTDVEACYLISEKTGKKTTLFTLDDINQWARKGASAVASEDYQVRHLQSATFPYPDKPP